MVKLYYRINISYERVLRVTYRDYKSTVVQLLQKDNFVMIDQCNLQVLANEGKKGSIIQNYERGF